jgi:hypothetical protein
MNPLDTRNLLELAHRLGSTPRKVLIAAARMNDQPEASATACLDQLRMNGNHGSMLGEDCANLMLTPVDSYARDAFSTALSALWQGSRQTD